MSGVLHREPQHLKSPQSLQEAVLAPFLAQQLPQFLPHPFLRNKVSPRSLWGAVALRDRAQELSCHGTLLVCSPQWHHHALAMGIFPPPKLLQAHCLGLWSLVFPRLRRWLPWKTPPRHLSLPPCAKYRGRSPLTLQAPDNSQQPGNST